MSMFVDYFFNDFVHQVIGNVYRMFLEYITTEVTPRFKTKTIATYHKAIEVLRKETPEVPPESRLPAICVDPTLPLEIEEKSKQLWRVPVATIFSRRLFDPIYQDENIRITPGFVRYTSPVIVYMWFDSIYEMIDTEVRFLQVFHGTERWSKPFGMEVLCPLPDRVYTYDNPDGLVINWPEKYFPKLLETIDHEIPMFPMYLCPMVRLNSFSDIGERDKDSGDDIGTCRLQADFTFEFEVPTFYLVESYWQIRNLQCVLTTKQTLTSLVFEKDIQFIWDPEEPTDPESGILVPEKVIYDSETKFKAEEIKKWIIYEIQKDKYVFDLPALQEPPRGFIVLRRGMLMDGTYSFNEDFTQISFSENVYEPGDTVHVIVF